MRNFRHNRLFLFFYLCFSIWSSLFASWKLFCHVSAGCFENSRISNRLSFHFPLELTYHLPIQAICLFLTCCGCVDRVGRVECVRRVERVKHVTLNVSVLVYAITLLCQYSICTGNKSLLKCYNNRAWGMLLNQKLDLFVELSPGLDDTRYLASSRESFIFGMAKRFM